MFKRKAKSWFIGIVMMIFAIVIAALCVKVGSMDKTRTISPVFAYEQGLLDSAGEEVKRTTAIRTKDGVSIDGFKVDIGENPSVTYQLFFFDEEGEFISASNAEMMVNFDAATDSVPEGTATVRIVIKPINDPEVSAGEIAGYAGELDVTYNK